MPQSTGNTPTGPPFSATYNDLTDTIQFGSEFFLVSGQPLLVSPFITTAVKKLIFQFPVNTVPNVPSTVSLTFEPPDPNAFVTNFGGSQTVNITLYTEPSSSFPATATVTSFGP
jgi:hypothetical protein